MYTKANKDHLLVFARWPEVGRVKTRLAKDLGELAATELYRMFVEEILQKTRSLSLQRHLFFYPAERASEMGNWLQAEKIDLQPQAEGDLGTKMHAAFSLLFAGNAEKVLIIGTDSPDLPTSVFTEAIGDLDNVDAVIGPAYDGGYYLLGFTRQGYLPEVFKNISWSTETVASQTIKILQGRNRTYTQLPMWHDIDTIDDIKMFFEHHCDEKSRLIKYLECSLRQCLHK